MSDNSKDIETCKRTYRNDLLIKIQEDLKKIENFVEDKYHSNTEATFEIYSKGNNMIFVNINDAAHLYNMDYKDLREEIQKFVSDETYLKKYGELATIIN